MPSFKIIVLLYLCTNTRVFGAPSVSDAEMNEVNSAERFGVKRNNRQINSQQVVVNQSQDGGQNIGDNNRELIVRLQALLALLQIRPSANLGITSGQNVQTQPQGELVIKLPLTTPNPNCYAQHLLQNPELIILFHRIVEVCGGDPNILLVGLDTAAQNSGGLLGGLGGLLGGQQGGGLLGGLGGLLGGQSGQGGLLGGLGGLLGTGSQGGLLGGLGGLLGTGSQGGLLGGLGGLLGGGQGGQGGKGGLLGGLGGLLGGPSNGQFGQGGVLGGLGGLLGGPGNGQFGQGGLLGGLGGLLGGNGAGNGALLGGLGGLLGGNGGGSFVGQKGAYPSIIDGVYGNEEDCDEETLASDKVGGDLLGGLLGGGQSGGLLGNVLGGGKSGGLLGSLLGNKGLLGNVLGGGAGGGLISGLTGGITGGLTSGIVNGVVEGAVNSVENTVNNLPIVGNLLRRHVNEEISKEDDMETHNEFFATEMSQVSEETMAMKSKPNNQQSEMSQKVVTNMIERNEPLAKDQLMTTNQEMQTSSEVKPEMQNMDSNGLTDNNQALGKLLNIYDNGICGPEATCNQKPISNDSKSSNTCDCKQYCNCLSNFKQFSDKKPKRKYRRRKYKIVEAPKDLDVETQIPTNADDFYEASQYQKMENGNFRSGFNTNLKQQFESNEKQRHIDEYFY